MMSKLSQKENSVCCCTVQFEQSVSRLFRANHFPIRTRTGSLGNQRWSAYRPFDQKEHRLQTSSHGLVQGDAIDQALRLRSN